MMACYFFKLNAMSSQAFSLFVALGGFRVPALLFQRLRHGQMRWSEQGEIITITPAQAGIDPNLLHMVLGESPLQELVDDLSPWMNIEEAGGRSQQVCYSVKSPLREKWTQRLEGTPELRVLALRLVCFVFPREKLWEPQ